MNSCISPFSSLDNRYIFLFLDTNLSFISMIQSHSFLLVSSYLLSFQKYGSICRTFKRLIYWSLPQTLLLYLYHPKSPILLSLFLLLLFSPFLVFFLFFLLLLLLFFSFPSFFFFFLLFFLFLLLQFSLLQPLLLFTLLQTLCYLYLSHFLVNLRIVASYPWYFQNYAPLLISNHINLCSLTVFLIIQVFLFFYSLNHCFLVNFKLITNPIALLSNNASTITSFCILILSKPIFTVTSLNIFSLSRLQQDLLSITLESITNLLQLESN